MVYVLQPEVEVAPSSPKGRVKGAMAKGGFTPKNKKSPSKSRASTQLYKITAQAVDGIRSLPAVWNQGKALYGIVTKWRMESIRRWIHAGA